MQLIKKSRTCEEGGGTPQNFFLGFIDELEKQIFIRKTVEWANKKQNNFNIYNVAFKKKKNFILETLHSSVFILNFGQIYLCS